MPPSPRLNLAINAKPAALWGALGWYLDGRQVQVQAPTKATRRD